METIGQIKIDEGYRSEIYLCSMNKMSWLYGRNVTDRPITDIEWSALELILLSGGTQKDWANSLFEEDVRNIIRLFMNHGVSLNTYPYEVVNIVVNMAYNMGMAKFNPTKWPKFFKAIIAEDWKQAAREGMDSLWFKQVGQRSIRLMNSLGNVK